LTIDRRDQSVTFPSSKEGELQWIERWIWAGGGLLALGIASVAMVTAELSKGPAFIAGDQPVIQVRQKLQSDGWSNVQILREGRYLEAMGSKNGQTMKVAVDAQTGRVRATDDDDD
jgi:hypothetical protein